ncbi:hypothetical protein HDZ31DRAFT_70142 [Schizophyllum fasciatum]
MAQTPTQPLSSPYQARRAGSPEQLPSPFEGPARGHARPRQRTLDTNSEAPDSPFADPAPYRGEDLAHAQEEAYGGGNAYSGPYPAFHGGRQRSPPPPSYSTAAR